MFGHEYLAEDLEIVALTEGFEGGFEGDAGLVVMEVAETVVTVEGDEVEVAFGLVTL